MSDKDTSNEKEHVSEKVKEFERREKEHGNLVASGQGSSNSLSRGGSASTDNDSPEVPQTRQNSNPSPEGVDSGQKEKESSQGNLNLAPYVGTSELKDYTPSLEVLKTDDCLKFQWSEVPNATKYTIQITRPKINELIEKESKLPKYEMKNEIYNFKIGETIVLAIKASDASGQHCIVRNHHYVVGGNDVISELQVERNETAPHSAIDVTWTKPKYDPKKYKITILEVDANEDGISSYVEETFHTAVDLQPSTEYEFTVAAVFSDRHDGLPVYSEIIKTGIPPPELYKAEKVQAEKDPINPYRQIKVTWIKPNVKFKIKHYEVFLKSDTGEKTEVIKSPETKATFKYLVSNKIYWAYVTTVGKYFHKSKESASTSVRTDPARRITGFDIKASGKPIIEKCTAVEEQNSLMSRFDWKLPDLGIERYNYKLENIVAFVRVIGKEDNYLKVVDGTKAVPIPLKRGKLYEFHLVCSYVDLDNPTLKLQAVEKQVLVTDVGKPSILNVEWDKKKITVKWERGNGASKHFLKVMSGGNIALNEELTSRPPTKQSYTFDMNDYCTYGKSLHFIIKATGEGNNTQISEKNVLIGGDYAVKNVVANKDVVNSRRNILLSWGSPNTFPQGYKINVQEVEQHSWPRSNKLILVDEISVLEQTQTSYKFTELKTRTEYYFEVSPIYGRQTLDGSISNRIRTDERILHPIEHSHDFGKPEKLIHETRDILHDNLSVELSWSRVDLSENFKLESYHVELLQKGKLYTSSFYTKDLESNQSKIRIPHVKMGYAYDVKFTTFFMDLDTKKVYTAGKDYSFSTSPSQTKIHNCSWDNGVVNFSWDPVNGAKKYQVIIKDEFLQRNLIGTNTNKVTQADDGCQVKVQMTDELCIGRVCMTKVITYTDNNLTSETDWKAHLIGGDLVPRNVKAVTNTENPERCINITFDAPHKGQADEYIIKAKPTHKGRTKKMSSKSNSVTYEYLRKGVEYIFLVFAIHNKELSAESPSNAIKTEGDSSGALVNFGGAKGTYDLKNATISGSTTNLNVIMGDDFGKVRDLEEKITPNQHNDSVTITWKIPSFDNKSNDYKVEHYIVKIQKQNNNEEKEVVVSFIKGQYEYSTKPYDLELGHTYDISVATLYDDIDRDATYISTAVKSTVHTRPCKPKIVSNIDDKNNELRLEWNDVQGALRYEVDIYTENSENPLFHHDNNKNTTWMRAFDERFGYGTSHKAVITAIGAGNKTNSSETSTKTIGGELVPRNVKATINEEKVTDPNTQVFLTWEQPEKLPNSYKVLLDNKEIKEENTKFYGISCLVSGLKAGTDYLFKVVGVHFLNNKEVLSGGCFSNKIQTNPTPTQVKNLFGLVGENPSTMVHIKWDKVDAERPDESTMYRVCVTTEDEREDKNYREVYVTSEEVVLTGLEPATTYACTVAGGNSLGYGRNSEAYKITTKFGTPKHVQLSAKDNLAPNSLALSFQHAEGNAKKYIAVMYKHQDTAKRQVIGPVSVESGYIFKDLDFNSTYSVKVHGVFSTGKGDACWSDKYTTAPARTEITKADCMVDNEGNLSSREIHIKWKPDTDCTEHEVHIKRGRYSVLESQLIVKNAIELVYSCLYEATQYLVEVRSKNRQCYGEWSEKAIIELAPSKLENVTASLEEKGNHIVVQCGIAERDCPFYFVQAYCNGKLEGSPLEAHSIVDKKVVEVKFNPKVPAEKYHFIMWGENSGKVRGKASCSETVFSRPEKVEVPVVNLNDENPSTEIHIRWGAQKRCEKYELMICCDDQNGPENILIFDKTVCKYKCQCPGSKYKVAVRSIRGTVKGDWSDECEINLAPSEVKLLEDDCQDPVRFVEIKWEPLKHKPEKYVVKLFGGQEELATEETDKTEVRFEGIAKPGSLCYCTVTAIREKAIGKTSKSKHYRIMWSKPSYFAITPDENNPSQCANMKWEKPYGVNCFKLQIENNQTSVSSEILLENDNYAYRSGIPGNTYTVRLYCGCDSRYDLDFRLETMIMKPEAPVDIVVTPNGDIHGFIVEFKDKTSQRKKYEVTAEPLQKTLKKKSIETNQHKAVLQDLVAGESFSINVTAIVDDTKSEAAVNEGYIKTLPEKIQNLESDFDETFGAVIYKWDALKIEPVEYKVQWRVGNDTITEDFTYEPKFEIRFVKPAHCYSIRVAATNESGCGKFSQWETFITDPLPPRNIQVKPNEKNPTTSIITKFEDDFDILKSYNVVASCTSPRVKDVRSAITKKYSYVFNDLKAGQTYKINVQTLFCDKKSKFALQ
ncbi:uncharacterized protein LOC120337147 isoform X2 [Styela clava]